MTARRFDGSGLLGDVARFRRAVEDPRSSDHAPAARALRRRLLEPVAAELTAPHLTVVPHGALHYVPFGALDTGAGHVVDRHRVRVLRSASVLEYLRPSAPRAPALLALGNPDLGDSQLDLRFAEQEAIEVAQLFPRSTVLLRREASKTAFRRMAGDFPYLHIASHGKFDPERPLESGLLLADSGGGDGVLTVGDLYTLRLDAELVTLSACETGVSRIAPGDDLVGLARGFLYAGAGAIVASLWPVDDRATAQLMTAFYGSLRGGDRADALRDAQLAVRAQTPHPFYWAAFQIIGGAR